MDNSVSSPRGEMVMFLEIPPTLLPHHQIRGHSREQRTEIIEFCSLSLIFKSSPRRKSLIFLAGKVNSFREFCPPLGIDFPILNQSRSIGLPDCRRWPKATRGRKMSKSRTKFASKSLRNIRARLRVILSAAAGVFDRSH